MICKSCRQQATGKYSYKNEYGRSFFRKYVDYMSIFRTCSDGTTALKQVNIANFAGLEARLATADVKSR